MNGGSDGGDGGVADGSDGGVNDGGDGEKKDDICGKIWLLRLD